MKDIYDGTIGLVVGDALGVPVEFKTRKEIEKNPITSMREYGTHNQPMGVWSDDTSLTLALLDSIIQCKTVNYIDIMDKFSSWLLYGEYTALGEVFDVGNATSKAIMNYGHGVEPIECGGVSECENGNGSLMRILPLAFYLCNHEELDFYDQMFLIHNVSSLTHRHVISLMGCGIYTMVAKNLISERRFLKESIRDGIQKAFDFYDRLPEYNAIHCYDRLRSLDQFQKLPDNQIYSSGYVVHTLEAAIWCLLNTMSYKQCVLKAVNLGDDTDTVGAVTGGLAGIYYGAESIPKEWTDVIVKREYIKGLCDELQQVLMI